MKTIFTNLEIKALISAILIGWFVDVRAQQLVPFALIDLGDSSDYFFLFGSSAISSTSEIKKFSATGTLNALAIPHKNFAFNLAWNNVGINPAKENRDSVDLTKLLFPDAGNTGILAAIYWRMPVGKNTSPNRATDSQWRIGPYLEFSIRNSRLELSTTDSLFTDSVSTVTTTIEESAFTTINYNLGFRVEWTYVSKDKKEDIVQIAFSPYYNFFNLPNEDAANFYKTLDKAVPEKSILRRTEIHSAGGKISLSFRGFSLFADIRYNFPSKNFDLGGTNLEGTVFSIGTTVAVKAISF